MDTIKYNGYKMIAFLQRKQLSITLWDDAEDKCVISIPWRVSDSQFRVIMKYLTAEEFKQMVSWSNQIFEFSHFFFINYAFIGENTKEVSIILNFSRLQRQCVFLATYMWQ